MQNTRLIIKYFYCKIFFLCHQYWTLVLAQRLALFLFICVILIHESDHLALAVAINQEKTWASIAFLFLGFLLCLDAKDIIFHTHPIEHYEHTMPFPAWSHYSFLVFKILLVNFPIILYVTILIPKMVPLTLILPICSFLILKKVRYIPYHSLIKIPFFPNIALVKIKNILHVYPWKIIAHTTIQGGLIFLSFYLQHFHLEIAKPRIFLFVFLMGIIIMLGTNLVVLFEKQDSINKWFWDFIPQHKINHNSWNIRSLSLLHFPTIFYALLENINKLTLFFLLLIFIWNYFIVRKISTLRKHYYFSCILGNLILAIIAQGIL